MRQRTRFIMATTLAAGLVAAALPQSASAQFSSAEQSCRSTVAKSGNKYTKAVLKAFTSCHKSRDKSGGSTNCNDVSAADSATGGKVAGAATKFDSSVAGKCTGITPSDVLYGGCPAPCASITIANFGDVVDCEICLSDAAEEAYADDAFGTPTAPITDSDEAKCHGAITKNGSKLFNSVLKTIAKCQASAEKSGSESITACTSTDFDSLTQSAYDKAVAGITKSCTQDPVPVSLDACGGSLTPLELAGCVADSARDSAQAVITDYLTLTGGGATTTTTMASATTTTTMPVGDPGCPDTGELLLFAKVSSIPCTSNSDCDLPRTCNTSVGLCSTGSKLDSGWNGYGHNADVNDGVRTRAHLYCPGPAGPTCGDCDVVGIDPQPGNCRCANDVRAICDQPFQNDADDCGGALCECYFGAPFPLSSGGTPACVVNKFAEDISGTANVDAGSGAITANLRSQVWLGINGVKPCPVCGGKCSDTMAACTFNSDCASNNCVKDTPDDGIRDGLCVGGAQNGLSCDVAATNANFPARFGGLIPADAGYSIDCQPNSSNVSGAGLIIQLASTTGTSSMDAVVDCDGSGPRSDMCQCLVCSKDPQAPCNGDGDCSAQGGYCSLISANSRPSSNCSVNSDCDSVSLGSCSMSLHKCSLATSVACTTNADCTNKDGGDCLPSLCNAKGNAGEDAYPNQCTDGLCTDNMDGTGTCTTGPDNSYCDGLIRADGTGLLSCNQNADCTAVDPAGGNCTLVQRRSCFPPTITATGSPDPVDPLAVAVFCIPPTSNSGINSAVGLPGPGRAINQGSAKTYCPGGAQYQPGVGCP